MKKILLGIFALFIIFAALHATPEIALRTKVFAMGYPIPSFTSDMTEGEFHHELDRQKYADGSGKALTMEKPPFEKTTQSELSQYLVVKRGFLLR